MVQAFVWLTPVGPLRLLHEFQVEDGTALCKQVVAYTEGGVRDARMQYPLWDSSQYRGLHITASQTTVVLEDCIQYKMLWFITSQHCAASAKDFPYDY